MSNNLKDKKNSGSITPDSCDPSLNSEQRDNNRSGSKFKKLSEVFHKFSFSNGDPQASVKIKQGFKV